MLDTKREDRRKKENTDKNEKYPKVKECKEKDKCHDVV